MILYNKYTGLPYCKVLSTEDYKGFLTHKHKEFVDSIVVYSGDIPTNWGECRIVDGEFIPLTLEQMEEINTYGRILTEEERQLNELKPSMEEVRKAEQTIEILTLIQEVM